MDKVEDGHFVSVHYEGTLESGEVFDSSEGRHPMEVEIGAGKVIPGFEKALMGMALKEKKNFTLEPEEAYGYRDDSLTHSFERAEIPAGVDVEVGQTVALSSRDGQQVPAQIVEANDQKVVVDLNHPLAGKTLTFDIEVVGISSSPTQQPSGCGGGCHCGSDGD